MAVPPRVRQLSDCLSNVDEFNCGERLARNRDVRDKVFMDKSTSKRFAVKCFPHSEIPNAPNAESKDTAKYQQQLFCEVESLINFVDPYVIGFKGFTLPADDKDAMIFLEFCRNGSLATVLRHCPEFWASNSTLKVRTAVGIASG
jgi:serine/threonine protein kinase